MRTGTRRLASTGLVALAAALAAVGCDKVPLTAPASSTVTLSTPTRTLPTGGSTELSAQVLEPSGTVVQNGTSVRFHYERRLDNLWRQFLPDGLITTTNYRLGAISQTRASRFSLVWGGSSGMGGRAGPFFHSP